MVSYSDLLPLLLTQPEPNLQHDAALDAAMAAFLDFGVRRSSMNEIARRAGVSPATLYRWFEGKDELVGAVVLREARGILRSLKYAVDLTAPAEDQFAEGATILVRLLRDHPLVDRLKLTEPESILPLLTVEGAGLIELGTEYLVTLIRDGQRGGSLAAFDPAPIAEFFARVIHSMVVTPAPALPLAADATFSEVVRSLARLVGQA